MTRAVLAIDQGTTRTKAVVFDAAAQPIGQSTGEIRVHFPAPGWVEQDAYELIASIIDNARAALQASAADVVAIGLANQGETVVAWDRRTGTLVYNAIVWQDRRTDGLCERLKQIGADRLIQERTGLPVDPYFSATKIAWLLENVPEARALAARGDLLAGTTDAWFHWHLTGEHRTDDATASRTMLYNLRTRDWDDDVLDVLRIPRSILPAIQPSCSSFGTVNPDVLGRGLSIQASIVDQQAALFGQACYVEGDLKVTYGTGAFILLNAGSAVPTSSHGLLPTVAWSMNGSITYALDGGIYVAGAAVQWLRDGLGLIRSSEETAALAASVDDTGDVYFVPALSGLAAPYWDSQARGTIVGITRGTSRAHIVRATLEGIAFRTRDVVEALQDDIGRPITAIKVDGGASANHFLMQFLADTLQAEIRVAAVQETTALGVALMAGLGAGLWNSVGQLKGYWQQATSYHPGSSVDPEATYGRWRQAVARARGWARSEREDAG